MNREQKIDAILECLLSGDGWSNGDLFNWVAGILRGGFTGYENLTDAELDAELECLGISIGEVDES